MALIKCPECKAKISTTAEKCPKCGFLIDDDSKERAIMACNKKKMIKKIFFAFVFVGLVGIVFIFCSAISSRKDKEQQEILKQEQTKKDEQAEKQRKISDIKEKASNYMECVEEEIFIVDEIRDDLLNVWNNSIWETKDKKTNKYTMKNGKFVKMEKAINNYMISKDAQNKSDKLIELMDKSASITTETSSLYKGDKDVESIYDKLKQFSDDYQNYINLVVNPYGNNYDTYMENTASYRNDYEESKRQLRSVIE